MEMELLAKLADHIDELALIKEKNQDWLTQFKENYEKHLTELRRERDTLEKIDLEQRRRLFEFSKIIHRLEENFKTLMILAGIIVVILLFTLFSWHESSVDEQAANDLNAYLKQKYGSIQTIQGTNYLKVRSANDMPVKLQDSDGDDLPGYYVKID